MKRQRSKNGKRSPARSGKRSPGTQVVVRGTKALQRMRHPAGASFGLWQFSAPFFVDPAALQALDASTGRFDYATAVGDGLDSSVVTAVLCWKMRTFPEAPAVVQRLDNEQWRTVRGHPQSRLIARPNPFYDGRILWMATCIDFAFGEAFWLKIRNAIGEVIQLWYLPRGLVTPRAPADGSTFISHYEYRVGSGPPVELDVRDVVHFRFGMDPRNIRRGFSQLASVMREVYTDEQACAFTASILRNLGVIGVIISPEVQEGSPASAQEDVKEVRDYIDANFTGERRGKTLAVGSPTKAQLLQYNIQGFDVGPIRDISEERVTAATGIPAAVVGFGTGLQQTKVGATMRELVKLAWNGTLIPEQKIMAGELDRSLLPDFEADPSSFRSAFDTAEVSALWEDAKERADRVIRLFTGSVVKRGEARREIGLPTKPEDDIYVLPTTVLPAGDGDGSAAPGGSDGQRGAASDDIDAGTKGTVVAPRKQGGDTRIIVPDVNVSVPVPDVHVTVPVPEVRVEVLPAPVPVVQVQNIVNVPEPPAPVLKPQIIVEVQPARAVRIERDSAGRIVRIIREF